MIDVLVRVRSAEHANTGLSQKSRLILAVLDLCVLLHTQTVHVQFVVFFTHHTLCLRKLIDKSTCGLSEIIGLTLAIYIDKTLVANPALSTHLTPAVGDSGRRSSTLTRVIES